MEMFAKDLLAAFPEEVRSARLREGSSRVMTYSGIGLRTP
jgi:hypothetical protein